MTSNGADAIIPGLLFQGSYSSAADQWWIKQNGIRAVVNVTNEVRQLVNDADYMRIPIGDRPKYAEALTSQLDEAVQFIHKHVTNSSPVLVHCMAGRSRSGAVVVAYLKWSMGMSARDAFSYLRNRRPMAQPIDSFLRAVDQWLPAVPCPPAPDKRHQPSVECDASAIETAHAATTT